MQIFVITIEKYNVNAIINSQKCKLLPETVDECQSVKTYTPAHTKSGENLIV